MARLHILAEGQTEETFVNRVLKPHLANYRVWVDVRCLCAKKLRSRSAAGGILPYQQAKGDLRRWISEDDNYDSWFSTMFDLYGLPDDFPSFSEGAADPLARVATLEIGFGGDIGYRRFIPYLQLHEFEAILFSDPKQFDWEFIDHHEAIDRLCMTASVFQSPEHIDDNPDGAPSKRIIQEIPEYEGRKPSSGPEIAARIGLEKIREKCRHFDCWLSSLETLPRT